MSNTEQNLATAFAGESQANRKYLAFSKQAAAEGYDQVAKLFRATAEAETIHAHSHFKVMDGIKSTAENLKTAVAGETYEFTVMYPEFIKEAEKEGNSQALRTFNMANSAEAGHAAIYQKALDSLGKNETTDYYVCSICGQLHEGKEPPAKCPICGAGAAAFKKID